MTPEKFKRLRQYFINKYHWHDCGYRLESGYVTLYFVASLNKIRLIDDFRNIHYVFREGYPTFVIKYTDYSKEKILNYLKQKQLKKAFDNLINSP